MKIKKILPFILAFSMIFSFSACDTNKGFTDNNAQTNDKNAADKIQAGGQELNDDIDDALTDDDNDNINGDDDINDNNDNNDNDNDDNGVTTTKEGKVVGLGDASVSLGDYDISINDVSFVTDQNGKDAVVVTYNWTNHSSAANSFDSIFKPTVSQNGKALSAASITTMNDTNALTRKVNPGDSLNIQSAYILTDKTTPIVVQVSDPTNKGTKITKTYNF